MREERRGSAGASMERGAAGLRGIARGEGYVGGRSVKGDALDPIHLNFIISGIYYDQQTKLDHVTRVRVHTHKQTPIPFCARIRLHILDPNCRSTQF